MKKETLNRLKNLLEKYERGQTSLEEENAISIYLKSKDIPATYINYKAEFDYYAAFKNINIPTNLNELYSERSFLERLGQFLSKWQTLAGITILSFLLYISFPIHNTVENKTTDISETNLNLPDKKLVPIINSDSDTLSNKTIATNRGNIVSKSNTEKLSPKEPVEEVIDSIPINKNPLMPSVDRLKINDTAAISSMPNDIVSAEPNISKIQINNSTIRDQNVATFTLTENTTTGELERIAYLANKAGIEYMYIVNSKKKKIHEINIVMTIRSSGARAQLWVSVPKKSSFSETLSWTVDRNGMAISLGESRINHLAKAQHPIE